MLKDKLPELFAMHFERNIHAWLELATKTFSNAKIEHEVIISTISMRLNVE